jgi:hypothetical protein
MKSILLLVTLVLTVGSSHADVLLKEEHLQENEGSPGHSKHYLVVTRWFRGADARIDVEIKGIVGGLGDSTTIIDRKAGLIYRIRHSQKSYEVVNPENLQKQQEFAIELLKKQEPLPAVRPVLKPTGRKETIAGYSAEEYVATVGSSIFRLVSEKCHVT